MCSGTRDDRRVGLLGEGQEGSSFLTIQEKPPKVIWKHLTPRVWIAAGTGRPGQWTEASCRHWPRLPRRLTSQETPDHPDVRYVNRHLKLKWRYLFRNMVYTYLCVDFKPHIYRRFFFFFKSTSVEQKSLR